VRATAATLTKGAPIPGPLVKQTISICSGFIPDVSSASFNKSIILF